MSQEPEDARPAAELIASRTPLRPRVAVILGSGLGPLADEVENAVSIPYGEIPGFAMSTAPGHAGRLVLGTLAGQPVAVMAGRVHMYEGYSAQKVVHPVRALRLLGAEVLIVTNAAGGVSLSLRPGDLMLIADHINLTGRNPLVGPNDPALGPRFPDMSEAYSVSLQRMALQAAEARGQQLSEGVYVALLGPSYETPAEIRMVRALGADAVGMSTVMEVIAANHMGMQVLGISCITNMAAGVLPQKLTEEEVIETASRVRHEFAGLVTDVIALLGTSWDGPADGNPAVSIRGEVTRDGNG